MRLRALSVDRELRDALLKKRGVGKTYAVYDSVVYLLAAEGLMLMLARADVGNGPAVILIEHEHSFKSGYPAFSPGERFECGAGAVVIGEGRIIVEAGRADVWDPSILPGEARCFGELGACFKAVCEAARSRGISSGLGPFLSRIDEFCQISRRPRRGKDALPDPMMIERVRALAVALSRGREAEVKSAAQGLVGMGEGLTPSCDDLLVGLAGFLYGVRCIPSLESFGRMTLAWIRGVMEPSAERTTRVSSHFLREAARGRFTERTKDLLEGIFMCDEKRVERAAQRVLEYGATSGADLIFGVALGYEIARLRS